MGKRDSRRNRKKRPAGTSLEPLEGVEVAPRETTALDRPAESPDGLVRQGELFPKPLFVRQDLPVRCLLRRSSVITRLFFPGLASALCGWLKKKEITAAT